MRRILVVSLLSSFLITFVGCNVVKNSSDSTTNTVDIEYKEYSYSDKQSYSDIASCLVNIYTNVYNNNEYVPKVLDRYSEYFTEEFKKRLMDNVETEVTETTIETETIETETIETEVTETTIPLDDFNNIEVLGKEDYDELYKAGLISKEEYERYIEILNGNTENTETENTETLETEELINSEQSEWIVIDNENSMENIGVPAGITIFNDRAYVIVGRTNKVNLMIELYLDTDGKIYNFYGYRKR